MVAAVVNPLQGGQVFEIDELHDVFASQRNASCRVTLRDLCVDGRGCNEGKMATNSYSFSDLLSARFSSVFEKRGASTRTRSSSHNRKKSESAGEPAAYGRSSSTFTESPLRNFSLSRALIPFSSSLNVFTKCLDDGCSLAGTRVKTSAAAVKCFLSGLAIKISRNCFTRLLIFYLFLDCL
jgi:hypothetical protein